MNRSWINVAGAMSVTLVTGQAQAQLTRFDYDGRKSVAIGLDRVPGESYMAKWTYRGLAHEYQSDPQAGPVFSYLPQPGPGQFELLPNLPTQALLFTEDIALRPPVAWAMAGFEATFVPGAASGEVTGSVRVKGEAQFQPGDDAGANSDSKLEIWTKTSRARGSARLTPTWFVEGRTSALGEGRTNDPLEVSALNLDTGELITTRLFESLVSITDGTCLLESGQLTLNGRTGLISIGMNSPFMTAAGGSLLLTFRDGLITESSDAGIFDGLLPQVGSSSLGLSLMLFPGGEMLLPFDLGGESASGFETRIAMMTDGAVPSPGSAVLVVAGLFGLMRHQRAAAPVLSGRSVVR